MSTLKIRDPETGEFVDIPALRGKNYVLTEADKTEIAAQAADMVDIPTDDHINELIDNKLAAVPNAEEASF